MPASRGGFTIIEVIVIMALIATLAAVIVPGMLGRVERARVEESVESLLALADAVHDPTRGGGSFRRHVGAYPGALSHLTKQITTAETNSCGVAYTADQVAGWNGPYLNRMVPVGGLPLPAGAAGDTLVRELIGANADPVLKIIVTGVTLEDSRAMDDEIDGVIDGAAGGLRWGTPDGEGFVTVEYLIPIKGC